VSAAVALLARAMQAVQVMTIPATADDLQELLGDLDELVVERILEIGASAEEVAEALADVEEERQSGKRREVISARAAEVRAILEDVLLEEDEEAGFAMGPPRAPA